MGPACGSGIHPKCSGKVLRRKGQDLFLFRMTRGRVLCREQMRRGRAAPQYHQAKAEAWQVGGRGGGVCTLRAQSGRELTGRVDG